MSNTFWCILNTLNFNMKKSKILLIIINSSIYPPTPLIYIISEKRPVKSPEYICHSNLSLKNLEWILRVLDYMFEVENAYLSETSKRTPYSKMYLLTLEKLNILLLNINNDKPS